LLEKSEVLEFVEDNRQCSYFEDKTSDIRYKYVEKCSYEEQKAMLQRGWRRFGYMFFVPECKECDECKTLRIDIKNFRFSSSQRRVLNKNKDIKFYIQEPTVTYEHIDLFNTYHQYMTQKKGWEKNEVDIQEYYNAYVAGANNIGKEILFFKDNNLVAVALIDFFDDAISSVYCYYDPNYIKYSLGQFSILVQIQLAKEYNIPYVYLGYWIKDHFSLGYKNRYKPFEILQNRPNLDEKTIWKYYD